MRPRLCTGSTASRWCSAGRGGCRLWAIPALRSLTVVGRQTTTAGAAIREQVPRYRDREPLQYDVAAASAASSCEYGVRRASSTTATANIDQSDHAKVAATRDQRERTPATTCTRACSAGASNENR